MNISKLNEKLSKLIKEDFKKSQLNNLSKAEMRREMDGDPRKTPDDYWFTPIKLLNKIYECVQKLDKANFLVSFYDGIGDSDEKSGAELHFENKVIEGKIIINIDEPTTFSIQWNKRIIEAKEDAELMQKSIKVILETIL